MGESIEHQSIIQSQNNLCEKLAFQIFPNYQDCADTIEKMCERMFAVQSFVKGTLPPDAFLDIVDSHEIDVFLFLDDLNSE